MQNKGLPHNDLGTVLFKPLFWIHYLLVIQMIWIYIEYIICKQIIIWFFWIHKNQETLKTLKSECQNYSVKISKSCRAALGLLGTSHCFASLWKAILNKISTKGFSYKSSTWNKPTSPPTDQKQITQMLTYWALWHLSFSLSCRCISLFLNEEASLRKQFRFGLSWKKHSERVCGLEKVSLD